LFYEYNDLKIKCAEITNFEKAEGCMLSIANKLREVDSTLKVADKQVMDNRIDLTRHINDFA
jgi:hypothetical protein